MKKTLYDSLSLSPNASAELIQLAYHHLTTQLEPLVEMGNVDAKQRLASIRMAHQILSDTTQRHAYDQRLMSEEAEVVSLSRQPLKAATSPWNMVGLVMSALLLALAMGLYVQAGNAKSALQRQTVAHVSEREQLQGEISQLQTSLAAAEERSSTLKARLDNRQNQAFEQAVASTNRSLDQLRQREDQAARQREAEERRLHQQTQERVAQQESRNVQSEKRYWACMNEALNRMPSDRANAQCARLR